jgi:ketosteroid isomerase-like protein
MLTEQNKVIVLQFYKAFDDRKMEQALELLAPNFVAHLAGMPEPLDGEGFKQFGMSFDLGLAE